MGRDIVKKISAGGIIHHNGRYLTIRWTSEGTTEFPKGTIEPGETPEQACIREVLEETGYNVRIIVPLTVSNFTFDWHDGRTIEKTVHYFLLERIDELEPVTNREDNEDFDNNWLSAEEAYSALSFDDMKVALKKAISIVESTKK
jgi:8-oxo-dGTP pyrophosphatase MutT (NUDIX family)